ncbi:CaiB/BaiF CoA transferase family protein [Rhodococcus koreensis]
MSQVDADGPSSGYESDTSVKPLAGVKVLEFAGLGPAPQAASQLADLGAQLTTVHSPRRTRNRGLHDRAEQKHVLIDLATTEGREEVRTLVHSHDVLLEGFRPGVMEKFGLGPEDLAEIHPELIYARLTGWGQDGPLAERAGHDINYIGLTGALRAITDRDGRPVPPLNLIGDGGGGTMFAVVGILAALLERARSGRGTVIDVSIVDGTLQLSSLVWQLLAAGRWSLSPRDNSFDGGPPHYDVYECADGEYMAVGAIEQQFYDEFLRVLELDPARIPDRGDHKNWPELREVLSQRIRRRTRDEWTRRAVHRDACFTPVLRWDEVADDPHLSARGSLTDTADGLRPRAAPRLRPLVASNSSTPIPPSATR